MFSCFSDPAYFVEFVFFRGSGFIAAVKEHNHEFTQNTTNKIRT